MKNSASAKGSMITAGLGGSFVGYYHQIIQHEYSHDHPGTDKLTLARND